MLNYPYMQFTVLYLESNRGQGLEAFATYHSWEWNKSLKPQGHGTESVSLLQVMNESYCGSQYPVCSMESDWWPTNGMG